MHDTLIEAGTLIESIERDDWLVVDCRFNLMAPDEGREFYLEAHIAGAVFADLDKVLSHPPTTDVGRHPLPSPAIINERFSTLGINPAMQVIAYDAGPGVMASRLWWMLRYMGHERVAVLNG
ncbi:MAG: rhodanese-like domain-containing protein, partial [Pseudomonadota bacterium]